MDVMQGFIPPLFENLNFNCVAHLSQRAKRSYI